MNSHRVKQERRREKKGRRPHTNGLISRHHLLLSYVVRVFLLFSSPCSPFSCALADFSRSASFFPYLVREREKETADLFPHLCTRSGKREVPTMDSLPLLSWWASIIIIISTPPPPLIKWLLRWKCVHKNRNNQSPLRTSQTFPRQWSITGHWVISLCWACFSRLFARY